MVGEARRRERTAERKKDPTHTHRHTLSYTFSLSLSAWHGALLLWARPKGGLLQDRQTRTTRIDILQRFRHISRTYPSRDVIVFGQNWAEKRLFLYMTSGSLENKHFWHHMMSETKKLPVPVLDSLVFSRKLLPVLVFTGAAPPARQHQ